MKLFNVLLPAFAALALVGRADAQVVSIGLNHRVGHGSISLGFRFGDRRDACRPAYRVWSPGHYECRDQSVWVPGECRRVWVEPLIEWRTDYRGCSRQVLVRAGYWESVRTPGRYETRRVQVWVEGCWTSP
ncbi:MAG: hypothetical protein K8S98_17475 [Planctomycetes bacterium]|nr:hypothetical protein [Planctomycetota bacterium]